MKEKNMLSLPLDNGKFERISFDLSHVGKKTFLLDLDLENFSHNIIFQERQIRGFYEIETTILMSALLKEGDVVIDVGAHIGYFSLLASHLVGDTGRVYSFEPIEENRIDLNRNIAINRARNIRVIPKVVGDRLCQIPFHFNLDNDGGHALWNVGLHPFNKKSKAKTITRNLPMTTLDDHFACIDLDKLKMIKIDTEGNEFNVLKGAKGILEKYRVRCITWELNRFGLAQMGHTEEDIRIFMSNIGYETVAFLNGNLRPLKSHEYLKTESVTNLFFLPSEFVAIEKAP